jgi:hypothetical protein
VNVFSQVSDGQKVMYIRNTKSQDQHACFVLVTCMLLLEKIWTLYSPKQRRK